VIVFAIKGVISWDDNWFTGRVSDSSSSKRSFIATL
jgi:hypothetical protein